MDLVAYSHHVVPVIVRMKRGGGSMNTTVGVAHKEPEGTAKQIQIKLLPAAAVTFGNNATTTNLPESVAIYPCFNREGRARVSGCREVYARNLPGIAVIGGDARFPKPS